MELFTPAWKSKDKYKSEWAVENLTNEDKIERAAQEAYWSEVRVVAVKKLTDQEKLLKIAKNFNEEGIVRVAAAEKLTDQILAENVFAHVAKFDKNYDIRKKAITKLTSQEMFADVVKNADAREPWADKEICNLAFEKLTDQEMLADFAKNGQYDWNLRAAKKIFNKNKNISQKMLAHIAKNSYLGDKGRKEVFKHLTDQNALADIAINAYVATQDYDIRYTRMAAVEKLTNSSFPQPYKYM